MQAAPLAEVSRTGENRVLALVYDFDGTLIKDNMADHGLLASIGVKDAGAFWQKSNRQATRLKADKICMYMHNLRQEAKKANRPITKDMLEQHGKKLRMLEGLTGKDNWFVRTEKIAAQLGLAAEHYVVTSGLSEMVEASPIAPRLRKVFGSRYIYDEKTKDAIGPAQVVNYTTKTQYLFRINKGVLDESDDAGLNEYMPMEKRPVPFTNMLFIGDGYTDIPCFRLVKQHDGHSVAVLPPTAPAGGIDKKAKMQKEEVIESLVSDGRVDHISLGRHFVEGGRLEKIVSKVAASLAGGAGK